MSDVPRFQVRPSLRCYCQVKDSEVRVCGRLATWERAAAAGQLSTFYCDEHHEPTDRPVRGDLVIRAVEVRADVTFVATAQQPNMALTEAVARLELAVREVGGVLQVLGAHTEIGRLDGPVVPQHGAGRPRRVY